MATILPNFYAKHKSIGVGMEMYFTSASKPSRYGSWGIKDSTAAPCAQAPKCAATEKYIAEHADTGARAITWGLSEYGINNAVFVLFTSAVTEEQLAAVARKLEERMGMPVGSVQAVFATRANTTAGHAFRVMATGTEAYFITTAQQGSAGATLTSATTTVQTTITEVAQATGVTVQSASAYVVPTNERINPNGELPDDLVTSSTPIPTLAPQPGPVQPGPGPNTPGTPLPTPPPRTVLVVAFTATGTVDTFDRTTLVADIATALGLATHEVKVLSVRAASVAVEVYVDMPTAAVADSKAQELAAMLRNSQSALTVKYAAASVTVRSVLLVPTSAPTSSGGDEDMVVLYWSIPLAVVGAGILVAVILYCIWARQRVQHPAVVSEAPQKSLPEVVSETFPQKGNREPPTSHTHVHKS
jgi:hypothetical protein